MYAARVTADCRYCSTSAAACRARDVQPGAGRCCRRCRPWHRAHRERTERVELPDEPTAAVTTVAPPEVLDRGAEDELVDAVLEVAKAEDDAGGAPVEEYDRPGVGAYRSLAQSRGLDLETVVRHAVRGELRAVVEMPVVTDETPPPATAGAYETDEGDRDV